MREVFAGDNTRNWEMVDFHDAANITTGKLNANAAEDNGTYPFFTCAEYTLSINNYAFDCEAVLLAGNNANGTFPIKYYSGKFNAYQRTYVITSKDPTAYNCLYIKYFLQNNLIDFQAGSKGSLTKFLTLPMIQQNPIPMPPIKQQRLMTDRLRRIEEIKQTNAESDKKIDELKSSLLQRAFRGEL